MRFKEISAFLIVFLAVCFSFEAALALSLPLPPDTKVIREETVEAGGKEQDVTFCESDLSEEKLSSFYRAELEKRGYSIFMQQGKLGVYMKGDNLFMVMINSACPTCANAKTSIVLTESKMENTNPAAMLQNCEEIPSVPAYPGAQCMGSMRMKGAQAKSVRYSAPAETQEVIGFYRSQMPQAGWKLEQETEIGKHLPREAISGQQMGVSLNLEDAIQLTFKGLKNERCMITLMPSFIGRGTLINIIYEEAK